MVFFANAQGRITLEVPACIRLHWLPGPPQDGTRPLLRQLLRAQLQSGCCRLLLDARQACPLSLADQAWLVQEWLPQVVALAGPHYAAHLLATDAVARLSRQPVAEKARLLGARHQGFRHEAEALQWLGQQAGRPAPGERPRPR